MSEYRISNNQINMDGDVFKEILWSGEQYPNLDDIHTAQQVMYARMSAPNHVRDPHSQKVNDYLLVQGRRIPPFFGWKTVQVVNVFDEI